MGCSSRSFWAQAGSASWNAGLSSWRCLDQSCVYVAIYYMSVPENKHLIARSGWLSPKLPLRAVWFSAFFQLIGGGAQTATSMMFVMVADASSAGKRYCRLMIYNFRMIDFIAEQSLSLSFMRLFWYLKSQPLPLALL